MRRKLHCIHKADWLKEKIAFCSSNKWNGGDASCIRACEMDAFYISVCASFSHKVRNLLLSKINWQGHRIKTVFPQWSLFKHATEIIRSFFGIIFVWSPLEFAYLGVDKFNFFSRCYKILFIKYHPKLSRHEWTDKRVSSFFIYKIKANKR